MDMGKGRYFVRYCYLTIYGLVKYLPTPIGDILRYLVLKLFCSRLDTFWIHEGVTIHWPENVRIGKGTAINECVFINGFGSVTIGNKVGIGTGAKIFSAEHRFEQKNVPYLDQPIEPRPIVINDDVYIGMNAMILGGCTIGKGAVIGASSVVEKDIPEYAVVMGNPARVMYYR
jgi:acetyltransferase-like isoleucine patch superfamily enzyme